MKFNLSLSLRLVMLVAGLLMLTGCVDTPAHKTVRIGFYENNPKIYTSEEQVRSGLFVDLLEEIARQNGWSLQYVDCKWSDCLKALEAGQIDLMPDVAFTPDRAKIFDFHTISVVSSWSQVYSAASIPVTQLQDLDGKRVALLEAGVQVEYFTKLMQQAGYHFTPKQFPTLIDAFRAVSSGQADAVVTNNFFAFRNAHLFGLRETPILFLPSNLFFAAPKGKNADLLTEIDAKLSRWKQDPESIYYAVFRRYVTQSERETMPVWIVRAAVVLIGVFAALVTISFLLRLQVKNRTADLLKITQELRAERLNLESQVSARTAELLVAKNTAEDLARVKSDFISSMSHEIRNPMNAVIGFVTLAMEGDISAAARAHLKKATLAANSLLRIINDILDMSKIESGRMSLDIIEFDLEDVLHNAIDITAMRETKSAIALTVDHDPRLPRYYRGDPFRLGQVLTNLIGNAYKFTGQGEIQLSIREAVREDGLITLEFSVSDTGIGMTRDAQAKLFQKFSQADQSMTRKFGGSGLGLAICRELLALMEGDIWVERSAPDAGTEFRFRVKLQLSAENGTLQGQQAMGQNFAGKSILIVADERREVERLQAVLAGCTPAVVLLDPARKNPAAAWLLAHAPPDVILASVDQDKFGEDLKDLQQNANVIYLHAANVTDMPRAPGLHLRRPITPNDILKAVSDILLPDPGAAPEPDPVDTPHVSVALSDMKVLLVDDNELNRDIGYELMTRRGISVDLAENGRQACDMVYRHRYDAVLMDLQMPVMDGFSALDEIRRRGQENDYSYLRHVPVIAMTAAVLSSDVQRSLHAGFDAHVAKPFRISQLLAVLEQLRANTPTD